MSSAAVLKGEKKSETTIQGFLSRLILLCVLPLVLLAFFLAGVHIDTLQRHQGDEARDRALNIMSAIDRDLSARIAALQTIATSTFMESPSRLGEFYGLAQGFRKSFTGHVVLSDMSTRMLLNTRLPLGSPLPKLPVPSGFAAAPYVMKTGKPAVGDMFHGPIAKEPLVAVVVPVKREGQLMGLLLSIIETRQYQKLLDDFELPAGYGVSIQDSEGKIIARRPPAHTRDHETRGKYEIYDAKSTVSHWSVVLEVPRLIYFRPLIFAGGALMATIILIAGITYAGGRLASRKLSQAIESLGKRPDTEGQRTAIVEIEAVRNQLDEADAATKRSSKELKANEERYRTLFEAVNVGKSVTLTTGEINVNQAFCDMLGYEINELHQKNWRDLTPPEDVPHIERVLAPLLNGEKRETRFEKRYLHKNGSRIWADVNVAMQTGTDGKPLYFITTVIDITDRKQEQEELQEYRGHLEDLVRERTEALTQANLRLQELDRLKSMFIAAMSHELRTPLNSIIGFTGIMLMGMSGEISNVQKKQLTMVKSSAYHLLDLINEVIDVSKIEAGKAELQVENFDLMALILELRDFFAIAAAEKGLSFEVHGAGQITVTSDRRRVRQILLNLLGNAVKFTETGGVTVDVGVSRMELENTTEFTEKSKMTPHEIGRETVRVTVSDTGVGIGEKAMTRLFEAFSRIHIQGRPVVEGTGLGLYLSRRISELLGGKILVQSEPGRGSRFTLSLPKEHEVQAQ